MRRSGLVCVLAMMASGCDWWSLAMNAIAYDTIRAGESPNLVVVDSLAYVTLGDSGIRVVHATSGRVLATLPAPPGTGSADDLAVDGRFLFVLDAREPGHLSVMSLRDPVRPTPISRSHQVPVGPFAGVSASEGRVIVSGGTSALTVWRIDSMGTLAGPSATADLGRGQPDVLMARHGHAAFVSSHYWGPYFGLDVVRIHERSTTVERLARVELDGAGFTAGGAKPANFPIESAQLDDGTLLVAYARGVAIVDIVNPSAPRVRGLVDVGGVAVNVDAAHGFAAVAVAGAQPAVVILDSTARIVRRITLPPGTNPSAVAFQGARADRVLVAARDRGVMVFER